MEPSTATRQESPTSSSYPNNATVDEDISRSDGDSGSEKPVREKLRDATIHQSERGRLHKKRSLEEVDTEGDEDAEGNNKEGTRHVRKRSRDAVPGDAEEVTIPANGTRSARSGTPDTAGDRADEEMHSGLTSPKGKRTRDQLLSEARAADAPADMGTSSEERKTKRARDSGSPEAATVMSDAAATTKVPPNSGFANTSAASPFGALASKDASRPGTVTQTSDEKFKSSGFGSFATASASPFGAAAPKTTSPFGAATATGSAAPWATKAATPATQPSAFAAAPSTSSGFGNASSTSAFGSSSKPGGFGSTFGSALGGGSSAFSTLGGASKLSSFATSTGPKIEGLSSKPAKAFGATDDTDEEYDGETEEDEEGAKSPVHETDGGGEKDKRFYKQHIETGEEGETTMFQQRAKLYQFDKEGKKWVERGSGVLKLNLSEVVSEAAEKTDDDEEKEESEGKPKLLDAPEEDELAPPRKVHARLLLRAEGSQRVVLNSPVVKGAKFGDDSEPKGQTILFIGRMAGAQAGASGLDTLQVKMNAERAKVLWHHVQELQDKLA